MKRSLSLLGILLSAGLYAQIVPPLDSNIVQPMAAPGDDPTDYNAIKFDFDNAGNQTRRYLVSLAAGLERPAGDESIVSAKGSDVKYIESEEYSDISYYPNPVKSELNLRWEHAQLVESIVLTNGTGALLKTFAGQNYTNSAIVNFSEYPSGLYQLTLNFIDGQIRTLNIVKQ